MGPVEPMHGHMGSIGVQNGLKWAGQNGAGQELSRVKIESIFGEQNKLILNNEN